MKTVFKFAFFILLSISALGFVATAFLYIFNPDKGCEHNSLLQED